MTKDYSKHKWEIIFCFSIVFFFVCYGLVFNKIIINEDSLMRIYDGRSPSGMGRDLGVILTNTVGFSHYNPIVTSIISWLALLISSVYTIKLFDIKRLRTMIATTAIFYSYPVFAIYWRFGTDMWLYTLSTALVIYGIYTFIKKEQSSVFGVISIIAALFIYQAPVSILTSLFSIFYLEQIISNKFNFKSMLKTLGLIAFSIILYYVLMKGLYVLLDVNLVHYKGANQIGFNSIIKNLKTNIIDSYVVYAAFVTGKLSYFDYYHLPLIILTFNMSLVIYLMSAFPRLSKSIIVRGTFIILAVTIPISMNTQQIITNDFMVRSFYGGVVVLIYCMQILLERLPNIKRLNEVLVIVIIFMNINAITTEQLMQINLQHENITIAENVLSDLRKFEAYSTDTPVKACGSISENENYNFHNEYPFIFTVDTISNIPGPSYNYFMEYSSTDEYGAQLLEYLLKYIGEDINLVYDNECNDDAPSMPEEGYIYESNGIININFGSDKKETVD